MKLRRLLRSPRSCFRKCSLLFKIGFSILALGAFCEFGIYYVVIFQCSWPEQNSDDSLQNETLKAMFLADTHLLGPFKGHWFDKLRREWQMHRAFQTALTIFSPEAVFFLGDVFDEGMWVDYLDFEKYVKRFHSLFHVPVSIKRYIISGNHDIGFHYVITPELDKRFRKAFNSSSVQTVRLKGNTFILINSMSMERDGCFLCQGAVRKLQKVSEKLSCDKNPQNHNCDQLNYTRREYSQPILLQHFPLYRESDKDCTGPDSAPDDEKSVKFRETWDCVSKSSTELLLKAIEPRVVISGHTHHGCLYHHKRSGMDTTIPEYSVPSFSWRNRNDPSFYLGVFTKDDYRLEKCAMPHESTVIWIYELGAVVIVFQFLILRFLPTRQLILIFSQRIFRNRFY